jgi:hypothetical protein
MPWSRYGRRASSREAPDRRRFAGGRSRGGGDGYAHQLAPSSGAGDADAARRTSVHARRQQEAAAAAVGGSEAGSRHSWDSTTWRSYTLSDLDSPLYTDHGMSTTDHTRPSGSPDPADTDCSSTPSSPAPPDLLSPAVPQSKPVPAHHPQAAHQGQHGQRSMAAVPENEHQQRARVGRGQRDGRGSGGQGGVNAGGMLARKRNVERELQEWEQWQRVSQSIEQGGVVADPPPTSPHHPSSGRRHPSSSSSSETAPPPAPPTAEATTPMAEIAERSQHGSSHVAVLASPSKGWGAAVSGADLARYRDLERKRDCAETVSYLRVLMISIGALD